jgi:hypothetical protein
MDRDRVPWRRAVQTTILAQAAAGDRRDDRRPLIQSAAPRNP